MSRPDAYRSNGKHRDALGTEHSLVIRDGRPAIVPLDQATERELSTGMASIEAAAISIVDRYQISHGIVLDPERRGDAVSHLITAAWHEAQRYDGHTGHLCGFVLARLRWRILDWARITMGQPAGYELVSIETVTHAAVEYEIEARPLWQVLGVDLDDLSMPARFALVTLAEPIARGESLSAVAAACEVSRHAARDMLEQLRVELLALGVGP